MPMDFSQGAEPGYTPLRRPQQTPLKNTPIIVGDVAWTTTRCNRLLRPISSRISQLRKQRIIQEKPQIQSATEQQASAPLPTQDEDNDDLDWVPEARPRKRPRKTYSTRNVSSQAASQPGRRPGNGASLDLLIQPQIIRSSQDKDKSSEQEDSRASSEEPKENDRNTGRGRLPKGHPKAKKMELRHNFRQLAKTITPTEWMVYDGLYSSLDNLLQQTERSKPRATEGSRSLFSMCLRVIPQLIKQEQAVEDEKDYQSAEDMANYMYEDLETYGSQSEGGWKPLREVTRAHGIALISEAIENRLITPSISRGLILLCLEMSAFSEAEDLCRSLLSILQPISQSHGSLGSPLSSETRVALQTLKIVAVQSGRWDFLFRSLTTLLAKAIIPVEWMAREDMTDCWNQIFMFSANQDHISNDAISLIRTTVALACRFSDLTFASLLHDVRLACNVRTTSQRSKKPKCQETFLSKNHPSLQGDISLSIESTGLSATTIVSNLLGLLLSANSVRDEGSSPLSMWMYALHSVLLDFECQQEVVQLSPHFTTKSTNVEVSAIISFATVLLPRMVKGIKATGSLPKVSKHILSDLSESHSVYEALSTFARTVSVCWSQLTALEPFDLIDQLAHYCLSVATSPDSEIPSLLLRKVALTTAFDFAESSRDKVHLDWALEIEEQVSHDATFSPMANHNRNVGGHSGYRWDDAICEWIAETPAVAKLRQKSRVAPQVSEKTRNLSRALDPSSPIRPLIPLVPIKRSNEGQCAEHSPPRLPKARKRASLKRSRRLLDSESDTDSDIVEGAGALPPRHPVPSLARHGSVHSKASSRTVNSSQTLVTSDSASSYDSETDVDELTKLDKLHATAWAKLNSRSLAGLRRRKSTLAEPDEKSRLYPQVEIRVVRCNPVVPSDRGSRVGSRDLPAFATYSSEDELGLR